MKKIALALMLICFSMTAFARYGVHYVHGYYRHNGTYVRGHYAGNPGSGIHCHNNICR